MELSTEKGKVTLEVMYNKIDDRLRFGVKDTGIGIPEKDFDTIFQPFTRLQSPGAMEKGGTLKVSTRRTKEVVEVSFKDTGAGVAKENIKKIFTPFFTTKAKGLGLGLAISKRFIDVHGGNIVVKSREGKGSTFTVTLPIHEENGGETSDEE